ncbi:MAG: DNA-3-methyladenine glycosylase [Verrucomicrobia bacterium]|nr:DNA-3-methyladenine glycosylase [Verrucomicrobiota bacterium]
MDRYPPLSPSFFQSEDVVSLGQALLGKILCSTFGGEFTAGIIIETESYRAPEDLASHAYGGRRTPRTEVMYRPGGCAYIYLCYGYHHLFNVVTGPRDTPHAVLIRALHPLEGIDVMQKRRNNKPLSGGPATLTEAMNIKVTQTGIALDQPPLWIAQEQGPIGPVTTSPRVGIEYAKEWADKPWRFRTFMETK